LSKGVTLDEVDFNVDGERKSGFHMATFDVAAKTTSDVDQHDVRETWLILEGQSELLSGTTTQTVSRGDVIYIESQTAHQLKNTSDETLRVLALWW
jgi:quercetin dioxygenase-like cupin family protein